MQPIKGPATTQATVQPGERLTFDQLIGSDGQHLVVIQGKDQDPALIRFLMDPRIRPLKRIFELRAELRSAAAPPLLLASQIMTEQDAAPEYRDIAVLDALVEPTSIVLAISHGADPLIWNVTTGWCIPVPDGVTPMAAVYPLARTATMKISRGEDGRLSYEMVHFKKYHSVYVQSSPTDLKFELKSQHEENEVKK